MKRIPKNVITMTLFLCLFAIIFSCSKDTDLLLDSVLNDPEISIEEKERLANEVAEDGLVTRSFSFSPTNDAYLQNDKGHDKSIIRLQEDYRTSYLMFDLSNVNGTITDAVLQFSIESDEGDGVIDIHKGFTANWTEETLNIDTAPSLSVQLGSVNKSYKMGAPQKVALDASTLVGERTTLIMTHSTGNDLAFASKEHTSDKGPKLIVTYKAPAGSPLISQEEEENTSQENTAEQEEETTIEVEEIIPPVEEEPNNTTAATEGAYYVTTSGSAANNGLSEADAWSIQHAFENAIAGDVVYIKAGNYGNKQLVADNSGTSNKPIKFIGYTNSPGDLLSIEGSTFNYGDKLNPYKMPLLIGNAPNEEGQGTGITVVENYVTIENFQITKFKIGIRSKGNFIKLKNIIVTQMGDFNPSHSYPNGTSNKFLNYSGHGIIFSGNNSELHNSLVLNCGAQAITFNRANNIISKNVSVYSDNTTNPTDYYFLIGSETTNSKFYNTKVHRVGSLSHHGHGIVLKGNGKIVNNVIDGFEIINTFLEFQFPQTSGNIAKNGTVIKEANVNENVSTVGGLKVANGSHNNTFQNIKLTNCSILFMDWNDGLAGDVDNVSDDNTFDNITVQNAHSGIAFSFYQTSKRFSSADNNIFKNCTFKNLDYLFERDRANSNTLLTNCNIENVNNFAEKRIKDGPNYPINASYQNCTWLNTSFTPPN